MEVSARAGLFPASVLLFFLLTIPHACLASSVTLAWDPSPDADLAGYRIYYQANTSTVPFRGSGAVEGNAPVDGGKLTVASISGLDPANSYYFAVTAYNSLGEESVYSNIVQTPETLPPLVSVTSPADNSAVSGALAISAAATDNAGVSKVQFLVNGSLVHETATAPYTYFWDASPLPSGSYVIAARAIDLSGNEALSKSVTVSVLGDVTPPVVSLGAPPSDVKAAGAVNVSAGASDNLGVARIEVSIDGAVVLSSNQSPVSYIWNTAAFANGGHLVSARAYDAAGNIGQASAVVFVDNGSAPTASSPDPSTAQPTPVAATPTPDATQPLTLADAQLALQIASGQLSATSYNFQRLDLAPYLNGVSQPNGKVDTGDVVVILAKLTGKL